MNKYSLRVKYAGGVAYHKFSYEAPDMEFAVKSGYEFAKTQNPGIPIVQFIVESRDR